MSRPPPAKSRRLRMVDEALRIAEDSRFGYSQKPPSGRWGPDFDCSSLMYYIANQAGYDIQIGGDKVRFTGTMLKDFEKAGFQILPFANVGISDLKIGDILLNLALHAEVYVGNGESVGATSSETGGYVGEAGDQTGHEIEKHPVVTFDKDWDYILRPPTEEEETEEGDEDLPMNYGMQGAQWGYPQAGSMNRGYAQAYPQGNLGQMNGYSQANAGYPQAGMQGYQQGMMPMGPQGMGNDLCFVMGIEGAKNFRGTPNSRMALFDEDKLLMYITSFDQNGNANDIHVYEINECSEEMPQHLSPLMQNRQMPMGGGLGQQADYITREEFDQLKEMLTNGQSASTSEPNSSRSGSQQSASAGRSR